MCVDVQLFAFKYLDLAHCSIYLENFWSLPFKIFLFCLLLYSTILHLPLDTLCSLYSYSSCLLNIA